MALRKPNCGGGGGAVNIGRPDSPGLHLLHSLLEERQLPPGIIAARLIRCGIVGENPRNFQIAQAQYAIQQLVQLRPRFDAHAPHTGFQLDLDFPNFTQFSTSLTK